MKRLADSSRYSYPVSRIEVQKMAWFDGQEAKVEQEAGTGHGHVKAQGGPSWTCLKTVRFSI
jgi:hypothetical protein